MHTQPFRHLRMQNITKVFGPVTALREVNFSCQPGRVHALCGENGAGKSTLMKILAGIYQPDEGQIFLDDRMLKIENPAQALEAGISMLYQELDLAEDLTVYENIFLGSELRSSIPMVIDRQAMIDKTQQLCDQYGFDIEPVSKIRSLTLAQCQIVELLKALMRHAQIIVMDEPTSSLSEKEVERLFHIVRELKKRGLSLVYISHRMEEVRLLADDVSVLRDGEIVGTGVSKDMDIPTVVRLMVGRELKDYYPLRKAKFGDVYFEADHLYTDEGIEDVSFSVREGEVVGMAGLIGAGRTELARAIFGVQPLTSGVIRLNHESVQINGPADAIRRGIALLTEDRKRTGLCINLPSSWNMTLPNYERIGMKRRLSLRREEALCQSIGKKVSVKWLHPRAPVKSLSGGNQQKVVIGRWLMADSRLVIFDEPTRGIDVGSKEEVYLLLNELAEQGKALLVISSELSELFGIADRILVMRRGKLVGNLETGKTTPEQIMHLAAVEA